MSDGGLNCDQLLTDITDYVATLGLGFESVQQFELTGNIGQYVAAVWPQAIESYSAISGLNVTSVRVTFVLRIYSALSQMNPDIVDPRMVNDTAAILNAFSGGFTLGESVYGIDLLGEDSGVALAARAAYLKVGSPGAPAEYRIMDITIPILLSNVWQQQR